MTEEQLPAESKPKRKSGRARRAEVAANERRTKVYKLYMEHYSQTEIGAMLGVNQSTISRDIASLDADFLRAAHKTVEEHKARMLADIEDIEKKAHLRYAVAPDEAEWLRLRLLALERKAKLLGVDAPKRMEVDTPGALKVVFVDDWKSRRSDEPLPGTPAIE